MNSVRQHNCVQRQQKRDSTRCPTYDWSQFGRVTFIPKFLTDKTLEQSYLRGRCAFDFWRYGRKDTELVPNFRGETFDKSGFLTSKNSSDRQ